MKRIESADLEFFGASKRAVKLYNDTDPIEITVTSMGDYHMTGCLGDIYYDTADDLINALDSIAESLGVVTEYTPSAIAEAINTCDGWNMDLCEALCDLAGMSDEWNAAGPGEWEPIVYAAARALGVEVIR